MGKMSPDREVATMQLIVELFEPLDGDERRRVQRGLNRRYGGDTGQPKDVHSDVPCAYYVFARVTRQWERALLTGYWLQQVRLGGDFTAMSVNRSMRDCGFPASNITREFGKLVTNGMIVAQPETVGHRRFRLSPAGERWCQDHLALR
jgi:hypothetical protein